MTFAQRTEPVSLQGVLRETFALCLQTTRIGEWRIYQVVVGVLLVGMLTRQGEHIRESEPLALPPRLVFVVQPSVPRVMTVAWHPVVVVVTVYRLSGGIAERRPAVTLYIQLIEIAAKRGRQQVERIEVVAGVQVGVVDAAWVCSLRMSQHPVAGIEEVAIRRCDALCFAARHAAIAIFHRHQ